MFFKFCIYIINVFIYIFSPDGRKVTNKPDLVREVGQGYDLSSFDFRSGKMVQSSMRKTRRVRGTPYDYSKGG